LTGFVRGQTDKPAAPPGFELNNPWRVCIAIMVEWQLLTVYSASSVSCKREVDNEGRNEGNEPIPSKIYPIQSIKFLHHMAPTQAAMLVQ
jgi:hypothetical protein